MKEIKIINNHIFTLAGVPYGRIYQPIKMGENHFGIYNVYDSRQQILGSTRYDEVKIDGQDYNSLNELMIDLVGTLFNPASSGGGGGMDTSGQHFRIIDINLTGVGTEKQRVVNTINNSAPFSISSDEVVLFRIVSAPSFQQAVQIGQNVSVLETFYLVEGMGTGSYGSGNTQISATKATKLTQTSASATEISFGNIGFQSPWNYGNENGPWEISGLTIIKTIQEGVEHTYIFNGTDGIYGIGETPFTEESFNELGQNEVTVISDGLPPRTITESRELEVQDLNRLLEVAEDDITITIPETLYQESEDEGLSSVYFRVEWQKTGGKLAYINIEGDSATKSFVQGEYIKVERRRGENGYIVKSWGGEGLDISAGDGIEVAVDTISIDQDWLDLNIDNREFLTETEASTTYATKDEVQIYTAGDNIVIEDNVISTSTKGGGIEYIPGEGIDIDLEEISIDQAWLDENILERDFITSTEVEEEYVAKVDEVIYTAGEGIEISPDNIISTTGGPGNQERYLIVDNQVFDFRKHFYNVDAEAVEQNDLILNGWQDDETLVETASYLGIGNPNELGSWRINSTRTITMLENFDTGNFIAAWDLDGGTIIELPLTTTGDFLFTVYENDIPIKVVSSYEDRFLQFDTGGVKTLRLEGYIRNPKFEDDYDLIDILQFGEGFHVDSCASLFRDCDSLESIATDLDTSEVTDFSYMFAGCSSLETGLIQLDTSSAVNMERMLYGMESFNEDISGWDVRKVENMSGMFFFAKEFNQPIGSWTTSSLKDTSNMFQSAFVFNQDLGNWYMNGVTDTSFMFRFAWAFNRPLDTWNVSSVTTMKNMFSGDIAFNQDLNSWVTTSLTTIERMFYENTSFNGAIGNWNVSSVTNMDFAFADATSFGQDLSGWDVSSVTTHNDVFTKSKVTRGFNPFYEGPLGVLEYNYDTSIEPASWLATPTTIRLAEGFAILDVDLYVNDVIFSNYVGSTVDIGIEGPVKIKLVGQLDELNFEGDPRLIDVLDIDNITPLTTMASAFQNCINLETVNITEDTSTIENWNSTFRNCSKLTSVPSDLVGPSAVNMTSMFNGCTVFNQDLGGWDTSGVTSMNATFLMCPAFNGNITTWSTGEVTNMDDMFNGCTTFNRNIGNWDVSKVINFTRFLEGAVNFNQDISSWNVTSATNLSKMFKGASSFNQPIGIWDVTSATSVSEMLMNAIVFNNDLSSWDFTGLSSASKRDIIKGAAALEVQNRPQL